ncbi:sigma-54-dependent Fis family transcriptional regulator [Adhaeribacter aerolatus]|uniref:Sigma-54-dependent Fis family transcriptional regulator n=1 Tax=Adhaeribacter aerolatus TaxID=670289 RepID=A0A512B1B1_9BACT|nr:sigma-54 dependent transcriptional regulator [Adhaeribacter aerolatus]GEO05745.1 sigma-54-dependent Fis family transcriptional regulator [Adhaeribacter aerolatus]
MFKGNILIIDDEEKLRSLLARIIGLEGYQVFEAANGKAGLRFLEKENVQLVISDVKLPDINGIDLTAQVKKLSPLTEVVVLTAYGTIADGVAAMRNGAFDYITKGDDNDKIIPLVSRAVEKAYLQQRVSRLEEQVEQKYNFQNIIGNAPAFRETIELATKVAQTDTTVLLLGETGTGKEVFAQAIHQEGSRKHKPFVAVNCSAFSKDILESELFGHLTGAFTGAIKNKTGLLEEAHQGTLFLDEIGEMSLDLQAKLLRVLESGTFMKVGDSKPTQVDVRIIAATNRNLQQDSETGHFRLDLYYRLSVFQITLPPLRERKKDIDLLAYYYLSFFAQKINRKITAIHPAFLQALHQHPWRGNIRELKNVIERAVILTDSPELTIEHLPFDLRYATVPAEKTAFDLATIEKLHIQKVLQYTKGNKTETARLLNIGLTTLYRKIQEYQLE